MLPLTRPYTQALQRHIERHVSSIQDPKCCKFDLWPHLQHTSPQRLLKFGQVISLDLHCSWCLALSFSMKRSMSSSLSGQSSKDLTIRLTSRFNSSSSVDVSSLFTLLFGARSGFCGAVELNFPMLQFERRDYDALSIPTIHYYSMSTVHTSSSGHFYILRDWGLRKGPKVH